jgi:hypothetical protein
MVPADFDTADNQARSGPLLGESIVNVVTSVIADGKTAILVQPRKSTLNNPPINPKTTAVICTPFEPKLAGCPFGEVFGGVVGCRKLDRPAQKPDAEAALELRRAAFFD